MTKKERIQKFGEVFTPQNIVDQMCDSLQESNPNCYQPGTTFLEPACGDGVFVCEVLRRKFANCKTRKDYSTSLKSVWGMEIQPDNVEAAIRNVTAMCAVYFKPTKDDLETIQNHIILCDSLKVMRMMNELNEMEAERKLHRTIEDGGCESMVQGGTP